MNLTVLDSFGFYFITTVALNLIVVGTGLRSMLAGGWHGVRHYLPAKYTGLDISSFTAGQYLN